MVKTFWLWNLGRRSCASILSIQHRHFRNHKSFKYETKEVKISKWSLHYSSKFSIMWNALCFKCFHVFRSFYKWIGDYFRSTYIIRTRIKFQHFSQSFSNTAFPKSLDFFILRINGILGNRFRICLSLIYLLLLERLITSWRASIVWIFNRSSKS